MFTSPKLSRQAALAVLIVLQLIMLMALYAGVAPHPPATVAPFAMAPFLAASMGVALAGIVLDFSSEGDPKLICGLAILMAAVSYGPHKYFDAAFPLIWPAVIAAQVSAAVILLTLFVKKADPEATA